MKVVQGPDFTVNELQYHVVKINSKKRGHCILETLDTRLVECTNYRSVIADLNFSSY